jgi:transcription initiation factor TFIIIB Brf1 subunit/transcription initiation factor TFIIB
MGTKCKKCGQYEAEEDPTTGTVVCTNCGAVSEENQSTPIIKTRFL